MESASVGYVIKVPRTMTVRVSDSAGAIRLESLSGQITAPANAGPINLASVSGPVQVIGELRPCPGAAAPAAAGTAPLGRGSRT
jgi:hypothetical protein